MILVDFSQTMNAVLYSQLKTQPNLDLDFLRHMALNVIRTYAKKYKNQYGKVVVAIDSRNNWRKEKFEHYKANRKEKRDKSNLDWDFIYECFDQIIDDIDKHMIWKVVKVDRAEADDIIGYLTYRMAQSEKIMIVSSDTDFLQLHALKGVKQYSPLLKKMLVVDDAELALKEKIIRGDKGDGIPNIMSVDNSFVDSIRQKAIRTNLMPLWLSQPPENFCDENMLARYKMNESLIDLTMIPEFIARNVDEIMEPKMRNPTRMSMYKFLLTNDLPLLANCIEDF